MVDVAEGFAAFEGVPGEHAYNPIGSVHGGYAASLLDSACGCAVHSKLAPGDRYTTLELKVAYYKAITARPARSAPRLPSSPLAVALPSLKRDLLTPQAAC